MLIGIYYYKYSFFFLYLNMKNLSKYSFLPNIKNTWENNKIEILFFTFDLPILIP